MSDDLTMHPMYKSDNQPLSPEREASEIAREIFERLSNRMGRYPAMIDAEAECAVAIQGERNRLRALPCQPPGTPEGMQELLLESLGACRLLKQTWHDYAHPSGATVTLLGLDRLIKRLELVAELAPLPR